MSTVKANNHQVGQSATPSQNLTWYQPTTPDGTVRLGVGNSGATTSDVITASSSGITVPSLSASNTFGFKNRLINGGMTIDQRNAGASGTSNSYTVDRWAYYGTQASKGTWGQNLNSVTTIIGFPNYLGFQSSSAYSVTASDTFALYQGFEGYNLADLGFGTSSAKTITLSFYVYSSLTGTFGGSFKNYAGTRSYPFSYSVGSANTWIFISITIPGDTSGTWVGATNSGAAYVNFGLGQGSTYSGTAGTWAAADYRSATGATSVVGTSGATFYITGVQLEVGSQATSFDFRSIGQELALCQRYYEKSCSIGTAPSDGLAVGANGVYGGGAITAFGSTNARTPTFTFQAAKRAAPTITFYRSSVTTANGQWGYYTTSAWASSTNTTVTDNGQGTYGFSIDMAGSFSATASYLMSGIWAASAEL